MVLSYSPGTFETPTQAQPGETVGTIIFADESLNASASIANVIGSGSVAQIKSTVRGSTPLGGGGVYGDLEFFCNLDSSTSSSMVPFFKIGPQTMFDNGYGAHFPFPVSMSRQLAIGNELASQGPTPDHALVVNGNVAITGSLEITGAVTSSIISSSIIYSSGSNIFGDEDADSHMFNGRITASSHISTSGDLFGYNITAGRDLTVRRAITCNNITTVRTTHVTASGNISASGNIINTGNITTTQITASGDISSSATITAEHIESKDDMTVAGDLDVAGEIECDHLNISDVDDGIHFGNTPVLFIDASNNVNVGVDGNGAVDLELYGHSHTHTAGGTIALDAASTINLDSATGDIHFKDAGTTQLSLDMDGTAGAQILQLKVDSDDLVFKQYDGTEVLRIGDDATISANKRKFTETSSTVGEHNGDVVYFGGEAETIAAGQLVHYNSLHLWELADADDNTKSDGLLGIALGADADVDGVLLRGTVTLDHDAGQIGDVLYVSTTAGDATNTAPSSNNNIVRIIGYKISHNTQKQIWFNPDSTFVKFTT